MFVDTELNDVEDMALAEAKTLNVTAQLLHVQTSDHVTTTIAILAFVLLG